MCRNPRVQIFHRKDKKKNLSHLESFLETHLASGFLLNKTPPKRHLTVTISHSFFPPLLLERERGTLGQLWGRITSFAP